MDRVLIVEDTVPMPRDQNHGGIVLGQAKVRHDPFQVVREVVAVEDLFRRPNLL
jgi:hypothetical protein